MQTYEPASPGMIICISGGEYVKTSDHLAAINKRDNLIVEQGMQIEETYNVLEGKKVCDFAMSFGLISKAADRMAEISRLTALLDELDDSLSEKHDCP